MRTGCLIIASQCLIRMKEWRLKSLRLYFKREGKIHGLFGMDCLVLCIKLSRNKNLSHFNFSSLYVMEINSDNRDSLNFKHFHQTQNVLLCLCASCEKPCTHCFFGKVSPLCSCRKIPKQDILHIPLGFFSFLFEWMYQQFEKLPKT